MVGPIWPGLGRDPFTRCCSPSETDNIGVTRTCLMGLTRSGRWCSDASPRMAQNWLEKITGVPFHVQVCPPQVWLSLWMTWPGWPRANFDTLSLFAMYVYTNLILFLWTQSWYSWATVFTDLPDSRYPIKLNHAVSTTSVSHSKIKTLSKCDLLFPLFGKAFTHQWQIEHFCNFYFCTLKERNDCGHSCVKFIFRFS